MIRLVVVGVAAAVVAVVGIAGTGSAARAVDAQACTPGYSPCLPVRRSLDCARIPAAKKPVRVRGSDRYRLDPDRDGIACATPGRGGGRRSPWGVVLQRPAGREAASARLGDVLTVVGWSPSSFAGRRFRLCNVVKSANSSRVTCAQGVGRQALLTGTMQTFGTWTIRVDQGQRGRFRMTLRVSGRVRAIDTLRLGGA